MRPKGGKLMKQNVRYTVFVVLAFMLILTVPIFADTVSKTRLQPMRKDYLIGGLNIRKRRLA